MDPSGTPTARSPQRTARAEAAAWIVRLHGPHRSPDLESAFRDWLAAHPENGKQFERVTEAWDAGSSLPILSASRPVGWRDTRSSRRWILAPAVLVLCALIGWGAWYAWADPTYTTGVGEERVVRLDDGTRISLNSGTRVRIAYSDSQRRVELEHGEAYFEVASNPARPFIVAAGLREVIALGTVFVIRYDKTQTAVTLFEGKVAVLPVAAESSSQDTPAAVRSGEPDRELILAPGERVTFNPSDSLKLDSPRMEAIAAWRRGEVILDKTPLAEAIAELNRYDKVQLVIDDPGIAALPISGIYQAGDSKGFARAMAKLYDLELAEQSSQIHLRAATVR
jgi:transmembrane sensor